MSGAMLELEGLGVSEGVAIGRAVCVESGVLEVYRLPLPEGEVDEEIGRFLAAVNRAQEEIHATRVKVRERLGDELAAIFDAHMLFLADSLFLDRIVERIRSEQVNAEWAVHRTAEELGDRFAGLESPHLRERAEDLQDVSRYLLRSLQGVSHHDISEVQGEVVIVARDLTPSDAVRLGRKQVVGFVIEAGGQTSHTTIIARSLRLPLVVGVSGLTARVTDQDPVIVDGGAGKIILHPPAQLLEQYRRQQQRLAREERELVATRALAPVTRDGFGIDLMANIDLPEEIDQAVELGAMGVGLYRSEFLYIEKSPELPDEEDHFELYRRLLESMRPHPVVIRTYDLGGRKLAREVMETEEDNPVLGLRGIRLTLARPRIFKVQMRGLLRAALFGDLWIMLPMVSTVGEVRKFRAFAAEVAAELEAEGVPFARRFKLGIMIEVPAAAIIADVLAREVDFFSIGTNDLIQYALAVDRNNEHVSYLYRPLHPSILRMIRFIVRSAGEAGIDVGICGEMAADPRYTAVLLGLGFRRLSLVPRKLPAVKTRIRELEVAGLSDMVETCERLPTAAAVEGYVREFLAGAVSLSGSVGEGERADPDA